MLGPFGGVASTGAAVVLALAFIGVLCALLAYRYEQRLGHVAWWIGIAMLALSPLLLGFAQPGAAVLAMTGGVAVLWLLAAAVPQVPIRYTRWDEQWADGGPGITAQEQQAEQRRYGVMGLVAVVAVLGALLVGQVPQPVERQAEAVAVAPVAVETDLVARGQTIFQEFGCAACHSTTGAAGLGPSLKAKFGRMEQLDGGGEVLVDEAYLREAIVQPDATIVRGFQPAIMAGGIQPKLAEIEQPENLAALVEFIKSLQ